MAEYTLPAVFTNDWLETGIAPEIAEAQGEPTVIRSGSRTVVIEATAEQIGDLISRAEYYASFYGEDLAENRRYVNSAKNVLRTFTPAERVQYLAAYGSFYR